MKGAPQTDDFSLLGHFADPGQGQYRRRRRRNSTIHVIKNLTRVQVALWPIPCRSQRHWHAIFPLHTTRTCGTSSALRCQLCDSWPLLAVIPNVLRVLTGADRNGGIRPAPVIQRQTQNMPPELCGLADVSVAGTWQALIERPAFHERQRRNPSTNV